jgi:hypothetical protein
MDNLPRNFNINAFSRIANHDHHYFSLLNFPPPAPPPHCTTLIPSDPAFSRSYCPLRNLISLTSTKRIIFECRMYWNQTEGRLWPSGHPVDWRLIRENWNKRGMHFSLFLISYSWIIWVLLFLKMPIAILLEEALCSGPLLKDVKSFLQLRSGNHHWCRTSWNSFIYTSV